VILQPMLTVGHTGPEKAFGSKLLRNCTKLYQLLHWTAEKSSSFHDGAFAPSFVCCTSNPLAFYPLRLV